MHSDIATIVNGDIQRCALFMATYGAVPHDDAVGMLLDLAERLNRQGCGVGEITFTISVFAEGFVVGRSRR